MATTLGIVSDLHTELWTADDFCSLGLTIRDRTKDADIILLAGDIGAGGKSIFAAHMLFPDKQVCLLAGNHEFYGNDHDSVIAEMEQAAAQFPNVHFLNRGVFQHDNIRIVGATLWTDFNLFGTQPLSMTAASTRTHYTRGFRTPYPDFWWIRDKNDFVTASQMLEWHVRDKEWLMLELDKPFDGHTVMMTHHAPVSFAVQEKHKTKPTTPCYASQFEEELLNKNIGTVVWGHTHHCVDVTIEQTRFISNQVGYTGRELQENVLTETGFFGTSIVLE